MPRSSRKSAPRRDRGEDPRRVADEDPRANADVDDGEWEEDGLRDGAAAAAAAAAGLLLLRVPALRRGRRRRRRRRPHVDPGLPARAAVRESTTEVPLSGDDDEVRAVHVQAAYEDAADGGDDAPATLATRETPPLLLGEGPRRPASADERARRRRDIRRLRGLLRPHQLPQGLEAAAVPAAGRGPALPPRRARAAMARRAEPRPAARGLRAAPARRRARDWMHDAPSPADSPNAFLRGLLHATFQDANGYVEGLDAVAVERFRRRYDAIPSAG
ncbi:hypothetical protein SO694_00095054 [Aureococcus anophagefferens]|uniref:Uncharacterized protein n=1 Tax=Aureococcus anophagefferens TaxID=44056 RepID=A0ABR1FSF1_AURAN